MMRLFLAGAMLFVCSTVSARDRKPQPAEPDQFLIGRDTFIDVGPPFDFYELYSVRSTKASTSIERITITEGDACTLPTTFKLDTAAISEPIGNLLGRTNPCAIPEKDLRRELKRCKKCMVFSGANVTMQMQCGDLTRRIRMSVLDRDMFEPHPNTPQHTSWTMSLLDRLDLALGTSVMQRPIFGLSYAPPVAVPSTSRELVDELSRGEFDALFEKASPKLSELFRQAQNPLPGPSVKLLSSEPFQPTFHATPVYPVIARAAHLSGQVAFTVEVTSGGATSNLTFVSGNPLLRKSVETAVSSWKFPTEAAGRAVRATIEFQMNCPPVSK